LRVSGSSSLTSLSSVGRWLLSVVFSDTDAGEVFHYPVGFSLPPSTVGFFLRYYLSSGSVFGSFFSRLVFALVQKRLPLCLICVDVRKLLDATSGDSSASGSSLFSVLLTFFSPSCCPERCPLPFSRLRHSLILFCGLLSSLLVAALISSVSLVRCGLAGLLLREGWPSPLSVRTPDLTISSFHRQRCFPFRVRGCLLFARARET